MSKDFQNRFTGVHIYCPRCFTWTTIDKFIISIIDTKKGSGVFITGPCGSCTDIVQVEVAGESVDNAL